MSSKLPVILIFDVGKTNKKLILFNERYQLVHEQSVQISEIKDEDDFPCEDLQSLTHWILNAAEKIIHDPQYEVKAINFAAYGASLIFLDKNKEPITPLYNYLKPYPQQLLNKFYSDYGGKHPFSLCTASPVLGNLNSGMQLYRLKYQKPELFNQITTVLHLPQYLSFLFTNNYSSELTSIGCHTNLWNFEKQIYHEWIYKEELDRLLPEISSVDSIAGTFENIPVGIGIHDSSSALIPYLLTEKQPFLLLSTGTWSISLNPFNQTSLTETELNNDCLCYLSHEGKSIKASRLFAGNEHEQEVKRLAEHYRKPKDYYTTIQFNPSFSNQLNKYNSPFSDYGGFVFKERNLDDFEDYETAYHQLMVDLVHQQIKSTMLVLKDGNIKKLFIDGGFSKNTIYMNLMAEAFTELEVYAASIPHATAIGAALMMHKHWNNKQIPDDLIKSELYTPTSFTPI